MVSHNRAPGDQQRGATSARSHLFTVRLWKQDVAGEPEYRGSVREVITGANRSFRSWSELAAFMVAQLEEAKSVQTETIEGGRTGDVGSDA